MKNVLTWLLSFTLALTAACAKKNDAQNIADVETVNENNQEEPTKVVDGTDVGNGGFVVTCGEDIYFYDYADYMFSNPTDEIISRYDQHTNAHDISLSMIRNMRHIDVNFADTLQQYYDLMSKKFKEKNYKNAIYKFLPATKPTTALDFKSNLGEDCSLEQMISYVRPKRLQAPFMLASVLDYATIDYSIYQRLDKLNKAIAIVHESLYPLIYNHGRQHEVNTIPLTQFIFSLPNLSTATQQVKLAYKVKLQEQKNNAHIPNLIKIHTYQLSESLRIQFGLEKLPKKSRKSTDYHTAK